MLKQTKQVKKTILLTIALVLTTSQSSLALLPFQTSDGAHAQKELTCRTGKYTKTFKSSNRGPNKVVCGRADFYTCVPIVTSHSDFPPGHYEFLFYLDSDPDWMAIAKPGDNYYYIVKSMSLMYEDCY
jgi:hypothetical protein